MALVAGWLVAHHPSAQLRRAFLRRVAEALRECSSFGSPAKDTEAVEAATAPLWLLDGLWCAKTQCASAQDRGVKGAEWAATKRMVGEKGAVAGCGAGWGRVKCVKAGEGGAE